MSNVLQIKDVVRWETKCCGYMFNTTSSGSVPEEDELMTARVGGVGYRLVGECPGCGKESPEIRKVQA